MSEIADLIASGLVANEPYPKDEPSRCPDCGSAALTMHGGRSTLLGGPPGVNHVWTEATCDAGHAFTIEEKHGERWFTRDGRILMGRAGCFEPYIWKCAKCGGDVESYHTTPEGARLGDDGEAYCFRSGDRTFYECDGCGVSVEVAKPQPVIHTPGESPFDPGIHNIKARLSYGFADLRKSTKVKVGVIP